LENIPDTQGALDIGTGDGAFLEELLKKGFTEIIGVEPSNVPIQSSLPEIIPLIKNGQFEAKNF
jgi:predicted rRNA methylase YqxC with S4 and FtsJ domains